MATLRPLLFGLLGLAVVVQVSCGGSSNDFSDPGGDAGDPGSGGASSGAGGTQGGSVATGGAAATSNGGTAGTEAGGSGGTGTGGTGTGGTATGGGGGSGATGGSTGGLGGSSGLGGSAGFPTGGVGGVVGGSAGFGGAPDPACPFRTPTGACSPDGLQCVYDIPRMCLCVSFSTFGCTAVDPRCTAMAAAPPDSDRAIPVSTQVCACVSGMWACRFP